MEKRCKKGQVWDMNAGTCVEKPRAIDHLVFVLDTMDDEETYIYENPDEVIRNLSKELPKKEFERAKILVQKIKQNDEDNHYEDEPFSSLRKLLLPHIQRKELHNGPCQILWVDWATGGSEHKKNEYPGC